MKLAILSKDIKILLMSMSMNLSVSSKKIGRAALSYISQMSYSLVVILELNSISEVQYKEIMMIDNE